VRQLCVSLVPNNDLLSIYKFKFLEGAKKARQLETEAESLRAFYVTYLTLFQLN
jgi:hypothetical protein